MTLPMSRTPSQRMSACLSLNDCGIARLVSESIRRARSTMYWARHLSANCSNVNGLGLFSDAIHRDDHIVEGDAGIARHQKT
jgi:hypothetical protein